MENRPPWMPIALYYSGKGKILPIPPISKSIYPAYLKKNPKKLEVSQVPSSQPNVPDKS